jgi:hypothetical protein
LHLVKSSLTSDETQIWATPSKGSSGTRQSSIKRNSSILSFFQKTDTPPGAKKSPPAASFLELFPRCNVGVPRPLLGDRELAVAPSKGSSGTRQSSIKRNSSILSFFQKTDTPPGATSRSSPVPFYPLKRAHQQHHFLNCSPVAMSGSPGRCSVTVRQSSIKRNSSILSFFQKTDTPPGATSRQARITQFIVLFQKSLWMAWPPSSRKTRPLWLGHGGVGVGCTRPTRPRAPLLARLGSPNLQQRAHGHRAAAGGPRPLYRGLSCSRRAFGWRGPLLRVRPGHCGSVTEG